LKPAYLLLLVIGGIVIAPLAFPVLPLQATVSYVRSMSGTDIKSEKFDTGILPQHFADRLGWKKWLPQSPRHVCSPRLQR
jgi:hypothetical protein